MASIIIEDIVPTKWRLRLRDAEGNTREVQYRTGTPLELDADEVTAVVTGKKSEKEAPKPKHEKSRAGASEKPRTGSKAQGKAGPKTAKPEGTRKPEAPEEKQKPAAQPPKVRRRKPEPGPGPGALVWEETEDDGVPGVRASFERGAFKILHAGGDVYGLFYEWNSGKYQTLSCGSLEALKEVAGQWTEDGKLRAPRSNLGAEAAKVACAPKDEPTATPPSPAPAPTSEVPSAPVPADAGKDAVLMQGFEATIQKVMAARKGTP